MNKTFKILAEKTMGNRAEALKRLQDPEYNQQKTQAYRDNLARRLRASRNVLRG